jgi:hypothetical protein
LNRQRRRCFERRAQEKLYVQHGTGSVWAINKGDAVNLLMIAAKCSHNYWHVAANLIKPWFLRAEEHMTDTISTASVTLIRENEDGSADYQFNFPPEALEALTRLGILTAIQVGIEDAKRLKPEEQDD